MLEFAISLIGIVMFISVVLNVWKWLNTTIVERQAAFQRTRVLAGTATIRGRADTAGTPVPYRRPPIQLLGAAGSTGGIPGGQTPVPINPPSCGPNNQAIRQAEALEAQADSLIDTYNQQMAQVQALNQQLQTLGRQLDALKTEEQQLRSEIDDLTDQINDPNTDPLLLHDLSEQRDELQDELDDNLAQQAQIQAELDRLTPQRDQLNAQANATLQQATDLYQQADDLLQQGYRACP